MTEESDHVIHGVVTPTLSLGFDLSLDPGDNLQPHEPQPACVDVVNDASDDLTTGQSVIYSNINTDTENHEDRNISLSGIKEFATPEHSINPSAVSVTEIENNGEYDQTSNKTVPANTDSERPCSASLAKTDLSDDNSDTSVYSYCDSSIEFVEALDDCDIYTMGNQQGSASETPDAEKPSCCELTKKRQKEKVSSVSKVEESYASLDADILNPVKTDSYADFEPEELENFEIIDTDDIVRSRPEFVVNPLPPTKEESIGSVEEELETDKDGDVGGALAEEPETSPEKENKERDTLSPNKIERRISEGRSSSEGYLTPDTDFAVSERPPPKMSDFVYVKKPKKNRKSDTNKDIIEKERDVDKEQCPVTNTEQGKLESLVDTAGSFTKNVDVKTENDFQVVKSEISETVTTAIGSLPETSAKTEDNSQMESKHSPPKTQAENTNDTKSQGQNLKSDDEGKQVEIRDFQESVCGVDLSLDKPQDASESEQQTTMPKDTIREHHNDDVHEVVMRQTTENPKPPVEQETATNKMGNEMNQEKIAKLPTKIQQDKTPAKQQNTQGVKGDDTFHQQIPLDEMQNESSKSEKSSTIEGTREEVEATEADDTPESNDKVKSQKEHSKQDERVSAEQNRQENKEAMNQFASPAIEKEVENTVSSNGSHETIKSITEGKTLEKCAISETEANSAVDFSSVKELPPKGANFIAPRDIDAASNRSVDNEVTPTRSRDEHVPPPSPSQMEIFEEEEEEDYDEEDTDNRKSIEIVEFGDTICKRLSQLLDANVESDSTDEKEPGTLSVSAEHTESPINEGMESLNLTEEPERPMDMKTKTISTYQDTGLVDDTVVIEGTTPLQSEQQFNVQSEEESYLPDASIVSKGAQSIMKELQHESHEKDETKLESIVITDDKTNDLRTAVMPKGSFNESVKLTNQSNSETAKDSLEDKLNVSSQDTQPFVQIQDSQTSQSINSNQERKGINEKTSVDKTDGQLALEDMQQDNGNSKFEQKKLNLPLGLTSIEATPHEDSLTCQPVEDIRDRTPTAEALPELVALPELANAEEDTTVQYQPSGRRSVTWTESDLDISEQRDDLSTDSMYADDEDEETMEILFTKTYTEPVEGAEVFLSCTVVNSAYKEKKSEEAWLTDEAIELLEGNAAEVMSTAFMKAKKEMQDIHVCLRNLRQQMEHFNEDVDNVSLPDLDSVSPDYYTRKAITD